MIEKEKAKGKSQAQIDPFASMLDANEKIVWESTPTQPSLWRMIKGNLWPYQITLWLFALTTFMAISTNDVSLEAVAMAFSIVIGLILLARTIQWLFRTYHRRERLYAITDQRVLYYIKGLKRSIPLKALPYIDVYSVDEGGGWKAYYPMWLSARDAKDVRQLMKDTKRRLEKI